jgi:hypothetical protein
MGPMPLDRRAVLQRLTALGILVTPFAAACTGADKGMPMMGGSPMPSWMMNDNIMDPSMMDDMQVIMDLLNNHEAITRAVEDIDGGIRSRTTSGDARIAGLISAHVNAMKARIEQNRPIRHGDPLFAEIFKRHSEIAITIDEIPGGIQVSETSTNAQVTLLIRQHARAAVSQFVADGMARAMQPTPLPPGYRG